MNDGTVFVAGQYEPPANPVTVQPNDISSKEKLDSIRPMSDAGATILAGDNVDGVINNWHAAITITWHYVAPPLTYRHTAVRITPTNQSRWTNDPFWGFYFNQNTPIGGQHYITLSAAPQSIPDSLIGIPTPMIDFINRNTDTENTRHQDGFMVSNFTCSTQKEDALILQFLTAFGNYQNVTNNVNYTLLPFYPGEYNSNSFTHGLINSIGLGTCVASTNYIFDGWDNPLPSSFFGY